MQHWHVLRTAPQAELAVAEALGEPAYVPLRTVWRPCWLGRRRKVEPGEAPLLAGYVFLRSPVTAWPTVLATPAVRGVLLCDGRPAVVADAELAWLRGAAKRAPIAVGACVAVELGPFAGEVVTVRAVDTERLTIATDVIMLGVAAAGGAADRQPVGVGVTPTRART